MYAGHVPPLPASLGFQLTVLWICPQQGVLICIGGLGMVVVSDQLTGNRSNRAVNKVKGDFFMVAGAVLYGFSKSELFFNLEYRLTLATSERRRRISRAAVAVIRGSGSAWHVGHAHNWHPSTHPGA